MNIALLSDKPPCPRAREVGVQFLVCVLAKEEPGSRLPQLEGCSED